MKIIVSHPTGNANVRATIDAFAQNNMLTKFNTTIATFPNAKWLKLLPSSLRFEMLRRSYEIDKRLIQTSPFKEIGRLGFQKIGFNKLTRHEYGKFSVDAVYHSLDKSVATKISKLSNIMKPDAVYAYEDGALETFLKAESLEILRIYDLPKGYWRAERDLLGKELEKNPAWAMTLAGFKDSKEKLLRKDMELSKAQHIIVASSFTKSTLDYYQGVLPSISVVPYGFPPVNKKRKYDYTPSRKLKLLFVGSLSQLKGLANVLEAVEQLKEYVELTIVGRKSTEECLPLNKGLSEHRYISSLPHREVLSEMSKHDIFLFPSLFEGFGLVVTEAMSQGTPVITTKRTCGADIIKHLENGWIVDASSTSALVNQLRLILSSPDEIEKVGRAAMDTARSRPWSQYGTELVKVVNAIYQNQKLG